MLTVSYRAAMADDAAHISRLIIDSQREFCFHEYTDAGIALMLRLCSAEAVRSYLERGDVYFVAITDGTTIGVAGIREYSHLAHNFVASAWHRRGISKALWRLAAEECKRQGNERGFDLRASTYAISVYEKWGFVRTGPTDQEHGITSTPMRLTPAISSERLSMV